MDRLRSKVAIVTGAASGIGAATVELFAEEGAPVVLVDQDRSGETLAQRIDARGGSALFVQADISSEEEIRRATALAERRYGRIDILVNNAAAFVFKGLDATPEDWHRSLDVNIVGTALCSRYAAAVMKRTGGGAIVNLGSISSFVAQPHFLTYSATKAALVNMTRCMALDLAADNIRVNCVCPGTIRTSASDRHMALTSMTEEQFITEQAPLHLLKRIGQPREVAYAILFLASDEASFITAASLVVDGGFLAR
jgi:NAD(P)-dependent dehydrogenase (short-subunit alcohol dehydrogenase family)